MRARACLLASLVSACATSSASGGNGTIGVGQTMRFGSMALTPVAVIEDSRCPVDVQCVWAGRLVVSTVIAGPGIRETRSFELGKPQSAGGITMSLTRVHPASRAGLPIAPGDYRFTYEQVPPA